MRSAIRRLDATGKPWRIRPIHDGTYTVQVDHDGGYFAGGETTVHWAETEAEALTLAAEAAEHWQRTPPPGLSNA